MPVVTEPGRWLKNIKDGTIYGYSELLARNPMVKEISEEQAFPERFIPAAQRGRVTVVALDGDAPPPAPKAVSAELAAEAAKGFPVGAPRVQEADGPEAPKAKKRPGRKTK